MLRKLFNHIIIKRPKVNYYFTRSYIFRARPVYCARNFTYPIISLITFAKAAQTKTMDKPDEITIKEADRLYETGCYQNAYDLLKNCPENDLPEIQWRMARALYSVSKTLHNKNEISQAIRTAFNLISSAIQKDEENFAIHKWMAIILDKNAELDGLKARVTQIHKVQEHMNRAIELNPKDATSWYMLGVFEYNLADLSWMQRKIVSTVFASPPNGSYEKALQYFERAEETENGFYSMNWLMLGKCYLSLKNKEKAKEFLEKAAHCRIITDDDEKCMEEALKILKTI